ncbi:MAG TPA: prolyl oligopeptidase family serine peptidase [Rariglobus sp.]|nr:prolyl oligopeptidase family serine peptidase [Rariglobus sp.]
MKYPLLACLALSFFTALSPVVRAENTPALPPPNPLTPDYTAYPEQKWEAKFKDFAFRTFSQEGQTLPYRIYHPAVMEPGKKYPLVLFMHGAGERGIDNRKQFLRFAPTIEFWKKYPCIVLAPQCPDLSQTIKGEGVWVQTSFGALKHTMNATPPWPMRLARALLAQTIKDNPVDTHRIYVTGLSMGGFATWDLIQRAPDEFAAAMPVCGGADLAFAPQLAHLPIWVFHGDADDTVPVSRSRDMVAALKAAGGHPVYTEFPGVGHGAWGPTYSTPEIWDWLFAQVHP